MFYCFYRQKYLEERKAINSEINDTEDNEIIKICINSPKINKAKQTESKHEEDPLKIPKKRGRKKKIVIDDENINEEITEKKICRVNKPPIIKKRDNLFENVY